MFVYLFLQLFRESEATSMRLTEQAKVLKEEIRRLERNQERDLHHFSIACGHGECVKEEAFGGRWHVGGDTEDDCKPN